MRTFNAKLIATKRRVKNMKIGIDLDGVVFDTEKEFRVYSELFDMLELKRNSKIDNKALTFQERFNRTEEEISQFLKKYHNQIVLESNYLPGAKRIIRQLKEDGHELVLITARGGFNKTMIPITEARLKQEEMDIFNRYYWAIENKAEICKKESIDIMIDDYNKNCEKIAKEKIQVIYLKDAPSYELEENKYIKVLYNWGEVYRYIREKESL